jgi:hypothetical protein
VATWPVSRLPVTSKIQPQNEPSPLTQWTDAASSCAVWTMSGIDGRSGPVPGLLPGLGTGVGTGTGAAGRTRAADSQTPRLTAPTRSDPP